MPAAGSGRLAGVGAFDGVELDDLVLRGDRLTLRPWRPDDAEHVREIMQDGSMREFLAVPDPYTRADAERFVGELSGGERARGTGFDSAVVESGTGRLVGSAALRRLDAEPDIGYWIAPAAQGRGYATEATRLLADWAFGHGVRRVQLNCDVRNVASARTALAAGFRYEGTRRDLLLRPLDDTAEPRVSDLAWFSRLVTESGDPVSPAFAPFPRDGLSDGVVRLRPMRPDDAAGYREQENDPVTLRFGFGGAPMTADEARHHADRAGLDRLVGRVAALTIEDLADGRFAGEVHLRQAGPPGVGGIGYGVHPAYRGRGYTTRALRLLVPWAVGDGGFARLELGAKTDNVASQKAALAAGFGPDGERACRLRNPDGTYSDEVRFVLLNPPA
jgi:RimJ/RimL family protein N-acetyltransferase